MGCIEIATLQEDEQISVQINSNMGCIEISERVD